ncbi:MAG: hypothetical protein L0I76_10845 [Pseudonocardia sp.]|nr:hypothetical protein [Pseudonocardia sp.]
MTDTRRIDPPPPRAVPKWAVASAWTAVVAALPTVLWRALVGFGLDLGTPDSWRAAQDIPGPGTAYVLTLSVLQLLAAVLALRLVRPGGDVVPRWSPIRAGHRLPAGLVCLIALTGAVVLTALCALSILNWSAVDPFAGEPGSAWSRLCAGCYLATLLWPSALVTSVIGYALSRRGRNVVESSA